eukprot:NODE_6510_length_877_cov_32.895225_g5915_i0.p1 GENE.NODE_6510_length_877_cov_32.895225_g5915_i0~~NODE_6510_length_877_cov_32.895225_g5915_i0.p1  ORF type:complete len:259 (-),score=40.05 NODE_6510_length_877_cov_32.895225_g5915_i0:34-810(-)
MFLFVFVFVTTPSLMASINDFSSNQHVLYYRNNRLPLQPHHMTSPTALANRIRKRIDLADYLELNGTVSGYGLEIGVSLGDFMVLMLKKWKKCKKYYAVDPWIDNKHWDRVNFIAKQLPNVVLLKNFSSEIIPTKDVPFDLDFAYVDAKHDYESALEDIELAWPKVRPGGIIAGHDYVWTLDSKLMNKRRILKAEKQMKDNVKKIGAVVAAVEDFSSKYNLTYFVTGDDYNRQKSNYSKVDRTNWGIASWVIHKPLLL